jgi:CrcB protein
MLTNFIYVAIGGAAGASLRYAAGLWITRLFGHGFPLGVLTVNIVGSFLMGVFVVFAAQRSLTHLSPLVMTGFLGGFTTFSAFSLEAVTLFERGQIGASGVYVATSVVGSIVALFAGLWVAREIFA